MSEEDRLRVWIQNIVDVYEARSELFISEEECSASLYDRAKAALDGKLYGERRP